MFVSDARKNANRINAQKSTGPKTAEGKARSRANSFKHGLAGNGVVMAKDDLNEVDVRAEALMDEFNPQSPSGKILVRRMAVCSIQMDRGSEHETAATAMKMRHAVENFDDDRYEQAEILIDTLGETPRTHLRKLRRTPEGVDRLIEEWNRLRFDLTAEARPTWTNWHVDRALNLTGFRVDAPYGSPLKALTSALQDESRRAKALAELVAFIDREIAGLEAHRETLDFETIELDRSEAAARALYDPSKEADLARRYEAAAQRHFFRALKELRRVEAEYAARVEAEMASSGALMAPPLSSASRTFHESDLAALEAFLSPISPSNVPMRGPDGPVLRTSRPETGQ